MTHTAKFMDFATFINVVMWRRANARVHAGPMGLCFAWEGATGKTYAAFARGNGVVMYRAQPAIWPEPVFGKRRTR